MQMGNLRAISYIGIFLSMLVIGACAGNYGHFKKDDQVASAFIEGTVLPQFNYYYSGRDTMPYAIIGIDTGYTVPSTYWVAFSPEPAQLKKMSENIFREIQDFPVGAHILDSEGTIIGVWYSNIYNRSVTVDQTHRTVELFYRNPENDRHP